MKKCRVKPYLFTKMSVKHLRITIQAAEHRNMLKIMTASPKTIPPTITATSLELANDATPTIMPTKTNNPIRYSTFITYIGHSASFLFC